MKIETKTKNIKNGNVNIGVTVSGACMSLYNEAHFEAILHAMNDVDEKAFVVAMSKFLDDFMEDCDDCDD